MSALALECALAIVRDARDRSQWRMFGDLINLHLVRSGPPDREFALAVETWIEVLT